MMKTRSISRGRYAMNDAIIRSALIRHLVESDPTAAIYEELPLSRGRGRADCAAVNGSLCGFEIKGAGDSLRRLPQQIGYYDRIFEYSTVVVAEKSSARRSAGRSTPLGDICRQGQCRCNCKSFGCGRAKRNGRVEVESAMKLLWGA